LRDLFANERAESRCDIHFDTMWVTHGRACATLSEVAGATWQRYEELADMDLIKS